MSKEYLQPVSRNQESPEQDLVAAPRLPLTKFVWNWVDNARKERGLSLSRVAREAGVARSTLYRYRDRSADEVGEECLQKICDYFGWGDAVVVRVLRITEQEYMADLRNRIDKDAERQRREEQELEKNLCDDWSDFYKKIDEDQSPENNSSDTDRQD